MFRFWIFVSEVFVEMAGIFVFLWVYLYSILNMIKSPPCKVVLTVLRWENPTGVVVLLPGSSAHLQQAFGLCICILHLHLCIFVHLYFAFAFVHFCAFVIVIWLSESSPLVPSKIKRAGSSQNFDANGNIPKNCPMSSGSGSSPFRPRSSSWSRWGGLPSHAQAPAGKQSKIISQVLSGWGFVTFAWNDSV